MKTTKYRIGRNRGGVLVAAALFLGLMCSAASAAFHGTASTVLQVSGILIPLVAGTFKIGVRFLQAPGYQESRPTRVLVALFLTAAYTSSLLAVDNFHSLAFVGALALAMVGSAAIWNLAEAQVWKALSYFCTSSTVLTVAFWIHTRQPGIRFSELLHPNLWGLLVFGNFCTAGLIRTWYLRIAIQIANLLVILDSQSRSALLATSVAALVLTLFSARSARVRKDIKLLGTAALLVGSACLLMTERSPLLNVFSDAFRLDDRYRGIDTGFSGRLELWNAGLEVFEANPVLGVGARMESSYITGVDEIQYSHSGYISALAQFGAVGAGLFFALAGVRVRHVWAMAAVGRTGAKVAGSLKIFGYAAEAIFEPKLISIGNPVSLLFIIFLFMPERATRPTRLKPSPFRVLRRDYLRSPSAFPLSAAAPTSANAPIHFAKAVR